MARNFGPLTIYLEIKVQYLSGNAISLYAFLRQILDEEFLWQ